MARLFSGSGQYGVGASVTPINFDFNSTFSVFAWVYLTGTTATAAPFSNEQAFVGHLDTGASFKGWELHKNNSSNGNTVNIFLINTYPTTDIQKESTFVPAVSAWSHTGFTYNGSTFASGVNIYGNGATANSTATHDTLGNNSITNAVLPQFARRNNNTVLFSGRMADIGIWNVELTANEVAGLASGRHPRRVRSNALVAYWPFYGLASPEPDFSGSANNVTFTGTPTLANGPPIDLYTPRWPLNTPVSATAPSAIFRKTASRIGTRTGTRQTWAA